MDKGAVAVFAFITCGDDIRLDVGQFNLVHVSPVNYLELHRCLAQVADLFHNTVIIRTC